MHFKEEKCKVLVHEVIYLCHKVNREGIQTEKCKIQVIRKSPHLTNPKELQACLGMMNAHYIPNILKFSSAAWKGSKIEVTHTTGTVFDQSKGILNSNKLFPFDKKLTVLCNDSPYGLGAMLSRQALRTRCLSRNLIGLWWSLAHTVNGWIKFSHCILN